MTGETIHENQLVKPLPILFIIGLVLVNVIAIFQIDLFYIGAFLSFLYIIIVPGLLLLPFLFKKPLPWVLSLAMSGALSVVMLMLIGLGVNTFMPMFGIIAPLTTIPLLITFDVVVYVLMVFNFIFKKPLPFTVPHYERIDRTFIWISLLYPILACLGAIMLNDGGPNILMMIAYGMTIIIIPALIINREKIHPSVPAITLYMMALSFLLMNSMRGWFVTGHDILLEFHVFTLVNTAHLWSMSLYQDPYTACLSLTILPVFLQNLMHAPGAYIFKFFFQFLGAAPIVFIYYIAKEYVSKSVALLAGFVYIAFPTFTTDMAFLNRQGIALIFFGALLFIILNADYFGHAQRWTLLILLEVGMVLSHYSTSYVAVGIFAGAYIINRLIRLFSKSRRAQPILLTLPFVIILLATIILWSAVITKTSTNVVDTVSQITASLEKPFLNEQHTGVDQYSLVQSSQPVTLQQQFNQFVRQSAQEVQASTPQSNLYPANLVAKYPMTITTEPTIPITPLGQSIQSGTHAVLNTFYSDIKKWYAEIIQVLILLGIIGLLFGWSFRKNILRDVPGEYIALSMSGVIVLAGQTLLPSAAVDYGLLRLVQQNLVFLSLPIVLTVIAIGSIAFSSAKSQALFCAIIFLIFFAILSGFIPELTGGARPLLPLNNYGFYYNAYYTHAQEVGSIQWLLQNSKPYVPIQADTYFSNIKMIAYSNIAPVTGLYPATIQKDSYVYLDYNNVTTQTVIQDVGGDLLYYQFPINFLQQNKNLIYSNGGSEIYH